MRTRRFLPLVPAASLLLLAGAALAQAPKIVAETIMVLARDPGIQLHVRNKHRDGLTSFAIVFGNKETTVRDSPEYPLVVLAKDEGRLMAFASLSEAEGNLEVIDVGNSEYQAWDFLGRQATLSVLHERGLEHWLQISIVSDRADPTLRSMIASFLSGKGIEADPSLPFESLISALPRGWS